MNLSNKSKMTRIDKGGILLDLEFGSWNYHDCLELDKSEISHPIISTLLLEVEGHEEDHSFYPDDVKKSFDCWIEKVAYVEEKMELLKEDTTPLSIKQTLLSLQREFDRSLEENVKYYPLSMFYIHLKSFKGQSEELISSESLEDEEEIELVDGYHKEEKGCCERHHLIPNDNGEYRRTNIEWYIDEQVKEEYLPDQVALQTKNGQKKLGVAFLFFFYSMKLKRGDTVCFLGSAPGFYIMKLSRILGIKMVCVDDYPTLYIKQDSEYYSFEQVFEENILDGRKFDGIFVDCWFSGESYSKQYLKIYQFISRFPGIKYSIKRFVSYSKSIKRIEGSRFSPLIFSSPGTREVRELGTYDEKATLTSVSGIDDGLRYFNQYTRLGIAHSCILIHCLCYDCYSLSHLLIAIQSERGIRPSLILKVLQEKDKKFGKVSRDLTQTTKYIVKSIKREGTFKLGEMVRNSEFVWKEGTFLCPEDLQSKSSIQRNGGYRSKSTMGVGIFHLDENGIQKDGELYDFSFLKLDSENDGTIEVEPPDKGIIRYFRSPLMCTLKLSNGKEKVFALPRVNVTTKFGEELYYSPVGSEKVYDWEDAMREPPCPNCGRAGVEEALSIRDYYASFHPVFVSCDDCSTTGRFIYSDINFTEI